MELKINLADREDIAAAVPLLQLILDATPKTCGGQCHTSAAPSLPPEHPSFPCAVAPVTEAAAVFGNAVPLALNGTPSIAGAVPLPTVPAAMPVTTSAETTAPVPPVPASVPAAAAPSAPAAPSTPAPAVELDAKGLPWDERIHAGSKAKISDGTWRMKKQVDPALVAAVEAELRARVAGRQGAAVPEVPLPDGTPKSPDGWPFSAPTAPPVAPLPPALPVAPSVVADPTTFEQLMPRITAAVTAGTLPATAVGAACAAAGLASVVALQMSPQHVPQVWAALKQQYPSLA